MTNLLALTGIVISFKPRAVSKLLFCHKRLEGEMHCAFATCTQHDTVLPWHMLMTCVMPSLLTDYITLRSTTPRLFERKTMARLIIFLCGHYCSGDLDSLLRRAPELSSCSGRDCLALHTTFVAYLVSTRLRYYA